jgi:hypothetical protein
MLKWQRPDSGYRKCRNRRDHAILCFEECARDKTKMDLAFMVSQKYGDSPCATGRRSKADAEKIKYRETMLFLRPNLRP